MGYYNSFVIRIWCNDDRELIRGYIQHVSTEEHTYFLHLEKIKDFITGHLDPPPGDSPVTDTIQDERIMLAGEFGDIFQDE
ncbi:MAG: hypothetical protein JSW16_02160 [Dehalococcoidales bacterium]|nr:MAG: hypothetical protein JSW16_02160 [Dehalococcoidales bacterium]